MKYKSLTILILCSLLSACETMQPVQPQKTQARFEQEQFNTRMKSTDDNFKMCVEEIKDNSLYKRAYDEIFFQTANSANKYALLTKKEKLTEEQIEFLKEAIPILTKCRQIVVNGLSGIPLQVSMLKYYNTIDAVYIKLLKRELTIGEANEEKAKSMAQQQIEWSNATTDINARWAAMDRAEMEGRRQSAAALLPYMMQQQQNQQNLQMQQQMLYQQQLQNIIKAPPVLTSPTTTNCTTYGNQLNCTTR